MGQLSKTVERIETKLDEREKRFEDQVKRVDRLGFRFWVFIGIMITGLLSPIHRAYS